MSPAQRANCTWAARGHHWSIAFRGGHGGSWGGRLAVEGEAAWEGIKMLHAGMMRLGQPAPSPWTHGEISSRVRPLSGPRSSAGGRKNSSSTLQGSSPAPMHHSPLNTHQHPPAEFAPNLASADIWDWNSASNTVTMSLCPSIH
jgi:hypothetical protein